MHRSAIIYFALLAAVFIAGILGSGCATRREIEQFQADHVEFRQRQIKMEEQIDRIEKRLENVETYVDTLQILLGGNVRESFVVQEEILRSIRADSRSVSSELSGLIETLGARISDSDTRMRRLISRLDEVNMLLAAYAAEKDTTGKMAQFDVKDAERLYQQSFLDFSQGEAELARMGFRSYLELYPETGLADNALYWIGETFMVENRSDSARVTFERLINRFPDSNKLPTVLYKLGLIAAADGDREQAIMYFNRIISEFPAAEEATRAAARIEEFQESAGTENKPPGSEHPSGEQP